MALIECVACAHKISDKAVACPKCHHPRTAPNSDDGDSSSLIDLLRHQVSTNLGPVLALGRALIIAGAGRLGRALANCDYSFVGWGLLVAGIRLVTEVPDRRLFIKGEMNYDLVGPFLVVYFAVRILQRAAIKKEQRAKDQTAVPKP